MQPLLIKLIIIHDRGVAFNDQNLAIDWQLTSEALNLSLKDKSHPALESVKDLFE